MEHRSKTFSLLFNLNKNLWQFPRIEIIGINEVELESDIVETVMDWILKEDDHDGLLRVLKLDRKTRRWLRDHPVIEGWADVEKRAKQIIPVPNRILGAVQVALCENIIQQLCGGLPGPRGIGMDFWETYLGDEMEVPEVETVWEMFFGDEWANTRAQDSRFKKFRNRAV